MCPVECQNGTALRASLGVMMASADLSTTTLQGIPSIPRTPGMLETEQTQYTPGIVPACPCMFSLGDHDNDNESREVDALSKNNVHNHTHNRFGPAPSAGCSSCRMQAGELRFPSLQSTM